jgi:cysteine desulfurase
MPDTDFVYLDYNATTPVDPRVLDAILPYFGSKFGNAASRHHRLGGEAADAVERARGQVAGLIGADPREIIWTSGATESDNLAIRGVSASTIHAAHRREIITVRTEHRAVLDPCVELARGVFHVRYLSVDRDGMIDLDELAGAISDKTLLVSIMHANNETGVLHSIEQIGKLCKEKGVLFHTDATQSFGREPIDVNSFGIDLLSLSGHKIYAPKGVGALYVRRKGPRVRCQPLVHGGGHERGLRSGTLNVPGIVGLGEAAEICRREMKEEGERVRRLRDHLERGLLERLDKITVNGHRERRLTNTLNVSFAGIDADAMMANMPAIMVSSSSACTSAAHQLSYVLYAQGVSEESVRGSVRFSLGRFTTEEEIDRALTEVVEVLKNSPVSAR